MPHMLHLFNVFHENEGKENCAKVLEEELHRMLGIKNVNDEHDCNVVSMNSLNIRYAYEGPSLGKLCLMRMKYLRIYLLELMFVPSLGMLCLMKMIFLASQVLICKVVMMIACLLPMMIILMKVGSEECQL